MRPGYEQRAFPESERRNKLRLIASRDGRAGSVTIHQDVNLYDAVLQSGDQLTCGIGAGRHAWIQVIKGAITANGILLSSGDGAAITNEAPLKIAASENAEILLFDLA